MTEPELFWETNPLSGHPVDPSLERKRIKKNFKFEPKRIAIPDFPPDDEIALFIKA